MSTTNHAPDRKHAGFRQMPTRRLGSENLLAVADYMLQLGSGQAPAAGAAAPPGAAKEPGDTPKASRRGGGGSRAGDGS